MCSRHVQLRHVIGVGPQWATTHVRQKATVVCEVRGSRSNTGNESVPKIIVNDTINSFFKLQSAFWQFQTVTVSECCSIKSLPYISSEKYIYILALKMASPGNRHCANCIGTLSLPVRDTRRHTAVPSFSTTVQRALAVVSPPRRKLSRHYFQEIT